MPNSVIAGLTRNQEFLCYKNDFYRSITAN